MGKRLSGMAAAALLACTLSGAEPRGIPFQRAKLDADDLAEVTGLNLYKFRLDLPKGQRFKVVLRELRSADEKPRVPFWFAFQHDTDKPLELRVAFIRADRKLAGFLLGTEKEAEFRLDCPGCSPSGVGTIIERPLLDLPPTQRTLFVHRSEKDNEQQWKLKDTRLITLVGREKADEGKPAPPPTGFPRAELVVELEP